ncbi:hypothetical protein HP439_02455 [Sphingobacterium shayense]|uniref:hypothetical protein n=1 Tax=Sphingobacterium shayense TaxID=626343 RepID=UPI0015518F55|nr:hypothetical protein [Sphingobacterium shayense]NQD69581.1 hypothetical protein [Sphingobacterium shayense]
MYWFKKNNFSICIAALTIVGAAFFHSCKPQNQKSTVANQHYADLPEFFEKEIKRLTKLNPTILKTVVKDSVSESKKTSIDDWKIELSSFASIDLNKPAHKGLFKKDSTGNKVTYRSVDPKIDIQQVDIQYQKDGTPFSFLIKRKIENTLYKTSETLSYDNTDGYSIEKEQHILLLGNKFYLIKGIFGKEISPSTQKK